MPDNYLFNLHSYTNQILYAVDLRSIGKEPEYTHFTRLVVAVRHDWFGISGYLLACPLATPDEPPSSTTSAIVARALSSSS